MRLVFFGDGRWATLCLQQLAEAGFLPLAVVLRTNPSDGSLAEAARELGLPIHQPRRVNAPSFLATLGALKPDLNVSVSYDQILRQPLIELAPKGFINAHAGKLPFYRGRNPINWALINDEKEIGMTVHYIDQGIDTGDIILQETLPVSWEDTYGSLLPRVQEKIPPLMVRAVTQIARGEARRQSQDPLGGSVFARRRPGDEWLPWADTSLNLYNKIRAISDPAPGARTLWEDQPLICQEAYYDPSWPAYIATTGEVLTRFPNGRLRVKTGDATLLLTRYHLEDGTVPKIPVGTRFREGV